MSGGAAAPAKGNGLKGLVDKVWNEDTKLAAYITIWYLGNIYCECDMRMYVCHVWDGGGVID